MTPEQMEEIGARAKKAWGGAHWINLEVRRNGAFEKQEGDWLKQDIPALLTALREAQEERDALMLLAENASQVVYGGDHGWEHEGFGLKRLCSDLMLWAKHRRAERDAAREALRELTALVRGEAPSLLNEDSGGDAVLALRIDAALSVTP